MLVRYWGAVDYEFCVLEMERILKEKNSLCSDEMWVLEHYPVFTSGISAKESDILKPLSAPLVKSRRGGKTTFHGPGQIIVYFLLQLKKKNYGIHIFVSRVEEAILQTLENLGVPNLHLQPNNRGIFCETGKKIASVGFRVTKGWVSHGISVNFNVKKAYFREINPCGMSGLEVANITQYNSLTSKSEATTKLLEALQFQLSLQP